MDKPMNIDMIARTYLKRPNQDPEVARYWSDHLGNHPERRREPEIEGGWLIPLLAYAVVVLGFLAWLL